jgi:hypothetical protein
MKGTYLCSFGKGLASVVLMVISASALIKEEDIFPPSSLITRASASALMTVVGRAWSLVRGRFEGTSRVSGSSVFTLISSASASRLTDSRLTIVGPVGGKGGVNESGSAVGGRRR